MADRALSTSRRALLGAAASIPFLAVPAPVIASAAKQSSRTVAREIWNARLARYQRLAARAKKAEETGWFRAANERFYSEMADPGTDRKAAFARMTRAENLFWHRCTAPMQEVAAALVLTPAPDLEALREKLIAIRAHQLHKPHHIAPQCFDVLVEDTIRLKKGAST